MERIKCTIAHITYQNQENGYAVLQAIVKGYRDKQTLVGTFHEVKVGAVLTVDGDWRVDKRYGRQFAAQSWSEELPATIVGIEKYLGSGLVKGIGPKAYHISTNDIQVLAPMQRSVVGAASLNMALQEAINPIGESLSRGGFKYRQGDRVMQIRNNYDKDTYNGDIGIIEQVDMEDRSLKVRFEEKLVEYEDSELDELTLAYATTIHKSQGSEYPVVVIPLLMTHYVMLQRNLLYTGITRAKKICIIVGTTKALAYCVHNMVVQKRNTKLKERLSL